MLLVEATDVFIASEAKLYWLEVYSHIVKLEIRSTTSWSSHVNACYHRVCRLTNVGGGGLQNWLKRALPIPNSCEYGSEFILIPCIYTSPVFFNGKLIPGVFHPPRVTAFLQNCLQYNCSAALST